MPNEPSESAFHHKKQLESLAREREVLENKNRVVQLHLQLQRNKKRLKTEQAEEHVGKDEKLLERKKKQLRHHLLDLCLTEIGEYKSVGHQLSDIEEELKHFIHLYVDREWTLHLEHTFGLHSGYSYKDKDKQAERKAKKDFRVVDLIEPDEALVQNIVKEFFDYDNAVRDTKGAILEKQKGPIGKQDKNLREKIWFLCAMRSRRIIFLAVTLPSFIAIVYVTASYYKNIYILLAVAGVSLVIAPFVSRIIRRVFYMCLKLMFWCINLLCIWRKDKAQFSTPVAGDMPRLWGNVLSVSAERQDKIRANQKLAAASEGSIEKEDLRYERSHVHIHKILAQYSRHATGLASCFMVLMLAAGILQLAYSLSFAFHVDPLLTYAGKTVSEGVEGVSANAKDKSEGNIFRYGWNIARRIIEGKEEEAEKAEGSHVYDLFYVYYKSEQLRHQHEPRCTLYNSFYIYLKSQERIGRQAHSTVGQHPSPGPHGEQSPTPPSDLHDAHSDPLGESGGHAGGQGLAHTSDGGTQTAGSGHGTGHPTDHSHPDVESHNSPSALIAGVGHGTEGTSTAHPHLDEAAIPHGLGAHDIVDEGDAAHHSAHDDSPTNYNINLGLGSTESHGGGAHGEASGGHDDEHKGGHSDAMKRALIALEMLLLAPLPYLLLVGLSRYIKALVFREQVDEFRRELLDFKSFEVALFIAIIAAALVSKALSDELSLSSALAFAVIIAVLAGYFLIIEWRSGEDAKYELAKEEQEARLEREAHGGHGQPHGDGHAALPPQDNKHVVVGFIDVNGADMKSLRRIPGVGPARAKVILNERGSRPFTDREDFFRRIAGIPKARILEQEKHAH